LALSIKGLINFKRKKKKEAEAQLIKHILSYIKTGEIAGNFF